MGALTASIKKRNMTGASKVRVVDLTFSNSYATGGDTLALAILELVASIDLLIAAPTAGLIFEFDHANKKLIARYPTGGSIAAPVSATAVPVLGAGATAVTASAATGPFTPGVGKEVGNTADLSTITCRAIVFGDNPYI